VDLGQQVDRRLQAGARRHGTSRVAGRDGRRDLPAGGGEIKAGGDRWTGRDIEKAWMNPMSSEDWDWNRRWTPMNADGPVP
jgi:hypothetical protein